MDDEVMVLSSSDDEKLSISDSSDDDSDAMVIVDSEPGPKAARKSARVAALASSSGSLSAVRQRVGTFEQRKGEMNAANRRRQPLALKNQSPDGTPMDGRNDAESDITTFKFAKILGVQVEELDLSHHSEGANLDDDLSCTVSVSLTSALRLSARGKRTWRSSSSSFLFRRVPGGASLFRTLDGSSVLQLDPRISNNQYPSCLQLDVEVQVPGLSFPLKASYDYVVAGKFIPNGRSDYSHGRGNDRDAIMISWSSLAGATRFVGKTVSSGVARGVLETALRSIEEASRREHVEDTWKRSEDPAPPSPSSGIEPGFTPTPTPRRSPSSTSKQTFARLPPGDHIEWVPRAVPLEDGLLRSYPRLDNWENLESTLDIELEKPLSEIMDDLAAQFIDLGAETPEDPVARKAAERYQLEDYVDSLVFDDTSQPGTVHRHFLALRAMLSACGFSHKYLSEQDWSLLEDKQLEGQHSDLHEVIAIFEARVGWTVGAMLYQHNMISSEPLIQELPRTTLVNRSFDKVCSFCGAFDCRLHAIGFEARRGPALNFPPGRVYSPTVWKEAPNCGPLCFLSSKTQPEVKEWDSTEIADLVALCNEAPTTVTCLGASELGKPCYEVGVLRRKLSIAPLPDPVTAAARPVGIPTSKFAREKKPWLPNSTGFWPCNHEGLTCDKANAKECSCTRHNTRCGHSCNCDTSCKRRFAGCGCTGACDPAKCRCIAFAHECDPIFCVCDSKSCGNNHMTTSRHRATGPFHSRIPGAGFGLILLEDAEEGDLIHTYAGEWIQQDSDLSIAWEACAPSVSYQFEIDRSNFVDSVRWGNPSRFLNTGHTRKDGSVSRKAGFVNCAPKPVHIQGTHQMGLYALRDIKAGTELLFDYGPSYPRYDEEK